MADPPLNARVRPERHKWPWGLAVFILGEAIQIGGASNYRIARGLFVVAALLMLWEGASISPVRQIRGWKRPAFTSIIGLILAIATWGAWKYLAAPQDDIGVRILNGVDALFQKYYSRPDVTPPSPTPRPETKSDAFPPPLRRVELELSPLVLIKRNSYRSGGETINQTSYGFAAILRARNPGTMKQFVRNLEVAGDIPADCGDYERVFGQADGTHEGGYLAQQCASWKPFLRLGWKAYPVGDGAVDAGGDEKFMRFVFLEPQGLTISRPLDQKLYFGLRTFKTSPSLLTTAPYIFDLVEFTRTDSDHAMRGFILRPEVKRGTVTFKVTLGNDSVTIEPKNIRAAADLFDGWATATGQDLFYGTQDKASPFPVPSK